MPPTSQGLMPSVGDTQLLTVCIKTFNAQFLKQKQSKNSRQDCCSYYEKGHPAGTKSTRISLLVAISEQHSLFKGYLFIRPLLSIFNSWPSHPASSSRPHLQSPQSIWGHILSDALFSSPHPPSQWNKTPCIYPFVQTGSVSPA